MAELHTPQGGTAATDNERIEALRAALRGSLLPPATTAMTTRAGCGTA